MLVLVLVFLTTAVPARRLSALISFGRNFNFFGGFPETMVSWSRSTKSTPHFPMALAISSGSEIEACVNFPSSYLSHFINF